MTSKTKTKIICELHPQHRGDINDLESMILQCKLLLDMCLWAYYFENGGIFDPGITKPPWPSQLTYFNNLTRNRFHA